MQVLRGQAQEVGLANGYGLPSGKAKCTQSISAVTCKKSVGWKLRFVFTHGAC